MSEEVKARGEVTVVEHECKGCGLCPPVCPTGCLAMGKKFNIMGYQNVVFTQKGCNACGFCYYACPEAGALTVYTYTESAKG